METENQPTGNTEQGRGYPRGRFNLLLVLLAVVMAIVGAAQYAGTRDAEPSGISEGLLQGDIAAKTAYLYNNSFPMLKPQAAELHDVAFKRYEEARRESPSPEVYRRLIIASHESGGRSTARYIARLDELKVDRARRSDLTRELAMWRTIYLSSRPLSRGESDGYAGLIRGLDLGWYESLALDHLYTRAGRAAEARAARENAVLGAARSAILLVLMMLAMLGLGLVGIGLLIWYAGRKRRGEGSADLPSASSDPVIRSNVAGYLLESFILYMWAIIAVQVGAGAVLDSLNIRLGAMGEVLLTVAVYVLSGVVALFFLAVRLQQAGLTWADIGLRSRRPFADILAGIGAYAAALPIVLLAAIAAERLSRYVHAPDNPIVPMFIESESWLAKLALFVLAAVAAPFFEELFFRGVLFNSLRAKWGVVAGVIVSAVLFGLVHPLPIGLLPILVLGAVFAVVFHERGSLLPCMVAHALNNAVAFSLLFILTG